VSLYKLGLKTFPLSSHSRCGTTY